MSAPASSPAEPRRYVIERLEIDGSWRPMAPNGEPLDFDTPSLARAAARGYQHLGAGIRVRDTGGC